ncbi:MAG: 5'-nucleotidase C-terminal domain-containing protein, partial [Nitrosopumilaceae archaeon]|nr:5'-nucleotidase C-terminal domain-containing protein [Nitrosopumilaceae archaeon]
DRAVENKFKIKNQKDSLKSVISEIKQKFPGVKLLIVLSHMSDMEDLQLKKQLNSLWRNNSIILGGHDHSQLISFDKRFENCMLVKGQSNARTLQLISFDNKITLKTHDLKKNLIVLTSKDLREFPKSSHIEKVIESWFKKLKKQNKLPKNKIIKNFSKGIVLDGTEVSLRKGTTNFGNFITDCLKNYTHADIAMINSGHFRGDRFYSEKIDVLDLLFTFVMEERENIMITQLTKKECLLFLNHAFSEVGKGRILQFSKNTQCVLKKIKSDEKVRVALISDMIYSNEDGFAKILAKNRKISIVKLRRTLEKDIVKDTNLIDAIIKTAHKVNYDPKVRKQIKVQNQ